MLRQNLTISGLGTVTYKVPSSGPYRIEGKLILPTPAFGDDPSQVVTTINVNGSPIYTGAAGLKGFKCVTKLTISAVVTIVLTSSAAVDQPLTAVKGTVTISPGI